MVFGVNHVLPYYVCYLLLSTMNDWYLNNSNVGFDYDNNVNDYKMYNFFITIYSHLWMSAICTSLFRLKVINQKQKWAVLGVCEYN